MLMSMVIAILRVVYDKEDAKPIRILLESLICGGLSLTASSAIIAMQLDMHWAIFTGGVIGYLGSATIKSLAVKLLKNKVK